MRPPGASGDAPLMMSRQAATLSDKANRGLLGQPGKLLRGIGLKGEQAVLGADHHVMPIVARLDQRDDVRRRALRRGRGRGNGTRPGSSGGGLAWPFARWGHRDSLGRQGWRLSELLDQVREVAHLLLESGEVGLQAGQPSWKREELGGPRSGHGGRRERWL